MLVNVYQVDQVSVLLFVPAIGRSLRNTFVPVPNGAGVWDGKGFNRTGITLVEKSSYGKVRIFLGEIALRGRFADANNVRGLLDAVRRLK